VIPFDPARRKREWMQDKSIFSLFLFFLFPGRYGTRSLCGRPEKCGIAFHFDLFVKGALPGLWWAG